MRKEILMPARIRGLRSAGLAGLVGAAFAAFPAEAGLPRCELTMQSSGTGSACLDATTLDGRTVVVPSNTTRIGKDGLALCSQVSSSNLATDIEYIIDNSASMSAKVFWVDSAKGDTSFYIQDCYDDVAAIQAVASPVALRQRHFGGTGYGTLGWDTLWQVPSSSPKPSTTSSSQCLESNDPYSVRAQVVQRAIEYQSTLDSTAQAGMVQFNKTVTQEVRPRALAGDGMVDLLDSAGLYKASSGTVWSAPLDTAFRRLSSSPNAQKAIIIVSDGEPDAKDTTAYQAKIAQSGYPPVYGIYLGAEDVSIPQMQYLTSTTGGRYWIVPPNRPDSLESVIRAIVGSVMATEAPATTTVANLTNAQTAKAVGITENADSTYSLRLDSLIALDTGANTIRLISSWSDESGSLRSDTTTFTIEVGGDAVLASGDVEGDSLFATVCREATSLQFLDAIRQATESLYEADGGFYLQLSPSDTGLSLPATVSIREWAEDDDETLRLAAQNAVSGTSPVAYAGWKTLVVNRPWSGADGDGTVQAANGVDTLSALWCYPRDGRDCAADTVLVRALKEPWIRWIGSPVAGSAGSLVLEAVLPGDTSGSVKATLRRHGVVLGSVLLGRVEGLPGDSLYRDTVAFRQGGASPGGDTLWIASPTTLDSLEATVVWVQSDSSLSDTAVIVRPDLELALAAWGTDSVLIVLEGAQADARGRRTVVVASDSGSVAVTLDSASGRAAVLDLLLGIPGNSATLRALFVDPVYGDTAVDSVVFAVPTRSIVLAPRSVDGPRGSIAVAVVDPWASGTLQIRLAHGADTVALRLVQESDGVFRGSFAFSQAKLAGGDTLELGAPLVAGGDDSVTAILPERGARPSLADTAWIHRPSLSLVLSVDPASPRLVGIALSGGTADAQGGAQALFDLPDSRLGVLVAGSGLAWSGSEDFGDLPESLDSVSIRARFVDPLYGDTAWASIRVAAPWYPGRVTATPDALDPREGDSCRIVVRDKDPDSTTVGTVTVTVAGRAWTLLETGANTGEYALVVAARDLDTSWSHHAAETPWSLVVTYVDPLHPQDVAMDTITLCFSVPPPAVDVRSPISHAAQTSADPASPGRVDGGTGLYIEVLADTVLPSGEIDSQGIAIRTWEPVRVGLFVYDKAGIAVTSWFGRIESADAETGTLAVVRWDGCDRDGRPAASGVYIVRVVLFQPGGDLLANRLIRIGRR